MFDPNIGVGTRFRKGISGNPGGRPRTRVISEALRAQLGEIKPGDPAGRTFAEVVAANLVEIACGEGPGAVHAANEIADRIEGRAPQSIQISDISMELRSKSDEELEFYLAHSRWPTDEERILLSVPSDAPPA